MSKLEKRLKDKNLTIKLSKPALDFLIEKGTSPQYGARPLKRIIQKFVENPLSEKILENGDLENKLILFYKKGKSLAIKSVIDDDVKVLTSV